MAERAKRLVLKDPVKLSKVNPESKKMWNKYETDLVLKELSELTIQGYKNDIDQFLVWIYDNCDNQSVLKLTEDDLIDYVAFRKKEGANSRRMKRIISSLNTFYTFMRKRKFITENPCENIERPKKDVSVVEQTFLSEEELEDMKKKIQEFVDNAQTISKKHMALQVQLYTLFSLSTLARVRAVSSIDWKQVDFDNRVVKNVREKEGKIVELYFSNKVKTKMLEIIEFRKENNIEDNGHMLIGAGGEQATPGTCHGWSKTVGQLIGIPSWHCHLLRKNQATSLSRKGMSLESIQALCHHEDSSTTSKFYIHHDESHVVEEKEKFED